MADLKIGDETFNVEVEGPAKAPVLMISNSLGSNLHMWDQQMPELTKHFRVVRYDSRGHGKSAASPGPYTFEQLGKDALAILDALGVRKAHWMGLSKGGAIGQWLLVNAPHRIERAVLANTGSQFGSADTWNERLRLVREQGLGALVDGVMDRWFTKPFQKKSPETVAKIRDAFLATPADGYAACMSALRDLDLREAIRSVRKPVMVIVGKHDPSTTPEQGQAIASSIKGARLVELDAAHLSNIEDAGAFTKAVVEFLTAPTTTARPASFPHRRPKKAAKSSPARTPPRAAKKAAKKATKKAAKKAAKKVAKKAAKKAAKKPAKKAAKKGVKKPAKKAVRKAVKKGLKKAGRKR